MKTVGLCGSVGSNPTCVVSAREMAIILPIMRDKVVNDAMAALI